MSPENKHERVCERIALYVDASGARTRQYPIPPDMTAPAECIAPDGTILTLQRVLTETESADVFAADLAAVLANEARRRHEIAQWTAQLTWGLG